VVAAGPGASSGNGFNPSLSLILSGLYTRASRDPSAYRISGFALPPDAEIGPGSRGFSIGESELGLAASVDPWFSGFAAISFAADNSASVEEAYVQTTSLGNGLTVKAGRYLSSIGYLNSQHSHVWDFVDAPLAYQAMLGGQFADDGLQVAWLAPTDTFIELRGEVGRGRSYPGSDTGRNGAGAAALALHTGGDIGDSSSWRAGLSLLDAKATDQLVVGLDPTSSQRLDSFSGRTRVWIADAVWKWAPNGNATRTNFKLRRVPAQHARRHDDGRRARVAGGRPVSRRAIGLVPASGLPVHARLAGGRAHRAARPRFARLRPERLAVRAAGLAPAQEQPDARLEPQRVLARAAAVRAGPLAPRRHRQPVVPAIHDEPGRPRRAQLLKGRP
jgi:hypothetical protein